MKIKTIPTTSLNLSRPPKDKKYEELLTHIVSCKTGMSIVFVTDAKTQKAAVKLSRTLARAFRRYRHLHQPLEAKGLSVRFVVDSEFNIAAVVKKR